MCRRSARHGTVSASRSNRASAPAIQAGRRSIQAPRSSVVRCTVAPSGPGPSSPNRSSSEPCNSRAIVRAYGTRPNRYSITSGARLRGDDEEAALMDGDRPRGWGVVQLAQPPGEPFYGEPGHGPADQAQVVDDRGDVGEPVQLLGGHGAVHREPRLAKLPLREQEPAGRLLGKGQAERVIEAVVCAGVDLLADERTARGEDPAHLGRQECLMLVDDQRERAVAERQAPPAPGPGLVVGGALRPPPPPARPPD